MEPVQAARIRVTPNEFFLWFGAMLSLYCSAFGFIFLVFNYIDYAFPNALVTQSDPYQGGMPYEMASIIILVPLYAGLMALIRRDIAHDPARKEVWIRRWALILTLFLAGSTIAGDAITLLTAFLRGDELTTAFLLKTLVVFLVAAVGFFHIGADLRGYWEVHPQRLASMRVLLGLAALASIVAGFLIVGSPYQVRQMRVDNRRTDDLQSITMQVVSYWQSRDELPSSLAALSDPLAGYNVPVDPETAAPYEYSTSGPLTFSLCAVFAREGTSSGAYRIVPLPNRAVMNSPDTWEHGAGRACFSRTIDPARYPPTRKTVR